MSLQHNEMIITQFHRILSDVDVPHPDEKSIITYVSSLYDAMPRVDVHDGLRANVSRTCLMSCVLVETSVQTFPICSQKV